MIQFNYDEIKNNSNDRNDTLRWLILNLMPTDEITRKEDDFKTDDGNFELKLIATGKRDIELDVEKLIRKLNKHGEELEKENRLLKGKLNTLQFKINQIFEEE